MDREAEGGGQWIFPERVCGFVAKGKASWESVLLSPKHPAQHPPAPTLAGDGDRQRGPAHSVAGEPPNEPDTSSCLTEGTSGRGMAGRSWRAERRPPQLKTSRRRLETQRLPFSHAQAQGWGGCLRTGKHQDTWEGRRMPALKRQRQEDCGRSEASQSYPVRPYL